MIDFEAKPYKIGDRLVLRLPDDASKQLPSRSQVMVKGNINGTEIYTALEPDGNFSHWLAIDGDLQKTAKLADGEIAKLSIEATKDWPEPTIPKDWQSALDADSKVMELWLDVTPMARWEWLRWINSSANPATRQRHIEVSCSKLLNGLRRPCCFNRSMCCVPEVSKSGVLLGPAAK